MKDRKQRCTDKNSIQMLRVEPDMVARPLLAHTVEEAAVTLLLHIRHKEVKEVDHNLVFIILQITII